MSMRVLPWLALALLFAGCAAINPFRLEDQIALFHDDLRWGRMPAAESQVDPRIRDSFVRRHATWGRQVRIVDVELEGEQVDGFTGTVRAHYTWLHAHDLDTRETDVETRWHAGLDGSWTCEDEQIVGGDPGLLATR